MTGQVRLAQFAPLAVLAPVCHDGTVLRRRTGLVPPLATILPVLGWANTDRSLTAHA
jgi:hypothetical protein